MNEKEAWLIIEKAYETPRSNRSTEQNCIAEFGICSAIFGLWLDGEIEDNTMNIMNKKIDNDLGNDKAYFCARDEAGDKFRAEYCRKQASLL